MRLLFSLAVLLFAVYPASADEYTQLVRGTAWVRTTTQGIGAGWIVDAERRWLITNLHVVGDQDKVEAFFIVEKDGRPIAERQFYLENQKSLHDDGRAVWGKVIARHEASDLALVELVAMPKHVRALRLADSIPSPGERVLSVGHRHDSEALWLACSGEVRQVGKLTDGYFWRSKKLAVNARCLITQSPILPGDSGGPLANEKGEIVGVVSGVRRAPQATIAIQVSEVRELLAQAKKENPVKQPEAKKTNNDLYRKLAAATVWVRPTATEGRAAGFVIDAERKLVLTTNIGAGNFDLVDVIFPKIEKDELLAETSAYADRLGLRLDGRLVRGIVLARDEQRDLAVIELDSLPKGTSGLNLSKDEPKPTDKVQAISHPSGVELLWLHSGGTVRQVAKLELAAKPLMGEWLKSQTLLLQIPHHAGSAGGAVVNENGEVVGLLATKEGTQQQLGYAIAASEIKLFLESTRPMYDPKTAEDFHRRGKFLCSRGDRTRGLRAIERACELAPKVASFLRTLWEEDWLLGGTTENAKKLVALKPDSLEYQACLAVTLAVRGEREEAIKLTDQILMQDRKVALAFVARSFFVDNGTADLEEAILLDPGLKIAYAQRALHYAFKRNSELAIADCSRVIELDPYDWTAIRRRAFQLMKTERFEPAARDFERMIEFHPKDPQYHRELARARMAIFSEEKALPELAAAVRLNNFGAEFVFEAIDIHGTNIRDRFPDDPSRRCKWFEQSLTTIRDAANAEHRWNDKDFKKRRNLLIQNIDDLFAKRHKDWDDKRWADELEKQIHAWAKGL